jgi:capsular exopolysaccharide synthesis family protein
MESRESIDLDFSRYLLTLKRCWLPAVGIFVITVTLAAIASTRVGKPSYKTEGKLLFQLNRTSFLTRVGDKEGEEAKELSPLVTNQNPLSTEIEVVNSIPLLQRTIDALNLKNKEGLPLKPEDIKKKLTVKIIGGTDVLRLSYESRAPKEAAAVVNKLMSLYIENDVFVKQTEAAAARAFLAKQLPQTEATVRQVEADLRTFKEKNNVVALKEEAEAAVKVFSDLDSQITTNQAELEKANTKSSTLSTKVGLNPQEAMAVSSLSQSPAVQGVLTELQGVEKQLALQQSRFQEQNPAIASLEAKKASLQTLLQEQIEQVLGSRTQVPDGLLQIGALKQDLIKEFIESEVQRLSLTRALTSLYQSRSAYQQRTNILPQLQQNQQALERKLDAAQSTYKSLLLKLQEAELEQNKNTSNARIIELAPIPEKPISGAKAKILALGVVLGLLLSTTTVLFLEVKDKSIKTLKEVRSLFDYPLLGVIPSFRKKPLFLHPDIKLIDSEIPVIDAPHSPVSETYRMIQANLKFLSSDNKLKIIAVTSSVPKEGKSTVSANLAAAIAQLGRRVLLIDADMRHPSQQDIWELTKTEGLSEVLVGQADFWAASCKVTDTLDVLTAGVRPSNPLALLDSTEMASLIKIFSDKYDFVVIDTPPLIGTADALTLGQLTDGILLVARVGVVDYGSVKAAKEMLERTGQNILGLVVNAAIQKDRSTTEIF